jgi:hypothetical protein
LISTSNFTKKLKKYPQVILGDILILSLHKSQSQEGKRMSTREPAPGKKDPFMEWWENHVAINEIAREGSYTFDYLKITAEAAWRASRVESKYPCAKGLGPNDKPRCPKCLNSMQNQSPADAPHLLRCATCKTIFQKAVFDGSEDRK